MGFCWQPSATSPSLPHNGSHMPQFIQLPQSSLVTVFQLPLEDTRLLLDPTETLLDPSTRFPSLSPGTGAVAVTHAVHAPVVYYGKRSAEPQLVYAGVPAYHHALTYAVPTVAVKPLTLNTEVVATGQSVPVAVGGYKAEAGDNGDL